MFRYSIETATLHDRYKNPEKTVTSDKKWRNM